jgi:hypothetical protein
MTLTMGLIRRRDFVEAPPLTEMQRALLEANIRPLYDDDVKEYKAQKLEATPPSPPGAAPAMWRRYPVGYCQFGQLLMPGSITAPGVSVPTVIPPPLIEASRRFAETGIYAGFEIEQLDRDPFLRVYGPCGEIPVFEKFYIGVWDEFGYCGG